VYEALADEHEPGIRTAQIDAAFAPLKTFLPGFTERVIEQQSRVHVHSPSGPYPVAEQRELGLKLMVATGFDLTQGRLDISHHPFCGGVPRDVRITTRYDESDFTSALMGILHEAGHAKYEQGLPEAWLHQPVGVARGMVIHESQSLLQEMQVCRGRAFIQYATPLIQAAFKARVAVQPEAYTVANLVAHYGRVTRSWIRVDADEVTYPAHVLLRYELERQLIDGALSVQQLPAAWDAEMQRYLGITTAGNDRDGCLQDVHWPSGAFGYFPLYSLGAMVAAQLFAQIQKEHPTLDQEVATGNFNSLNAWLLRHVWSRASSVSTQTLLRDATGEELNPSHFQRHLEQRYLA
jgi:carboxypeptidase Taq